MTGNNQKYFKADLEKYYAIEFGTQNPPIRAKITLWIYNFGLHCVAIYRLGRFSERLYRRIKWLALPIKLIHRLLDLMVKFVHHVNIDDAKLGGGFYIGHVGTIYIGPTTIGENCSLSHNVTIGIGHSQGKEGSPVIGNNVWIGTGSIISGAISVGNDVTIINGSVLSRSVPDGCLVGGNPARVILQNYDNTSLLGQRH
ncbi:MAG: serine acetyltransferase [candidate division Zixibacteria bacterium]